MRAGETPPDLAILVVEDNPDHLELILMALRENCDAGRIASAAGGQEAMDFLHGRGAHQGRDARKQPRLVILDVKMNPMDGVAVLKAMRDDPLTQAVPVVMLTSTVERSELDKCYEAGANSVVRKSEDYDELRRKMQRVYDFWVTVNEANRNSRV
ncbi:MAG: response regulator [Ramlibacter sp.]|nr:response regulator [Ramlibacter sp.]